MIRVFCTGLAFCATLAASTLQLSSGDANVYLNEGVTPTRTPGPPPPNNGYLWPPDFTYIYDGNDSPGIGLVFTAYELFTLPFDAVAILNGFGDDSADFSAVNINTLATTQIASGSGWPMEANFNLSAGDYLLIAGVSNFNPPSPGKNFDGLGYKVQFSPSVPEPSTWVMSAFGVLLTAIGVRRRKA